MRIISFASGLRGRAPSIVARCDTSNDWWFDEHAIDRAAATRIDNADLFDEVYLARYINYDAETKRNRFTRTKLVLIWIETRAFRTHGYPHLELHGCIWPWGRHASTGYIARGRNQIMSINHDNDRGLRGVTVRTRHKTIAIKNYRGRGVNLQDHPSIFTKHRRVLAQMLRQVSAISLIRTFLRSIDDGILLLVLIAINIDDQSTMTKWKIN